MEALGIMERAEAKDQGTQPSPCAGVPIADTWSDHLGTVHERRPGTNSTYCGLNAGIEDDYKGPFVAACTSCVSAHISAYALQHDCWRDGCYRPGEAKELEEYHDQSFG